VSHCQGESKRILCRPWSSLYSPGLALLKRLNAPGVISDSGLGPSVRLIATRINDGYVGQRCA